MGVVKQDMTLNEFAVLQLHVMKLYYVFMKLTFIELRTSDLRTGWFWFLKWCLFCQFWGYWFLNDWFSEVGFYCTSLICYFFFFILILLSYSFKILSFYIKPSQNNNNLLQEIQTSDMV